MSYSENETNAYNYMMSNFGVFDEIKKRISKSKCIIHGKKVKIEASWEIQYKIEIIISKYCCYEFAEQIAKEFIEADNFDSVKIEIE